MNHNPHYFWAVRLPDPVKENIFGQFVELKEIFPFKRWVHQDDYHITLAFLGSVEKQKLNIVVDSMGDAIKNVNAFSLQIEGINIFGNKKSPRIFWAALKYEERLHQLQAIVAKQCIEAGFSLEERSFNPHITLARNWTSTDFQPEILQRYNPFSKETLLFPAQEVVLYRTNLENTPKYECIATFSLARE